MQMFTGVLLLLLINSVAAQFFNPSRQAIMQVVIPSERRVEASAKAMFSLTGISVLSASLGPALFVWLGPVWAVSINVLVFTCSALCIASTRGLRTRLLAVQERPPFWSGLLAGLRFSWGHASIRALLMGVALYGFSLGVNNVALSLYAFKTLGLTAYEYGLVLAAFPVGGLIAALLVHPLFKGRCFRSPCPQAIWAVCRRRLHRCWPLRASLAGTLLCSQTLNRAQDWVEYFALPVSVYGIYIFFAAGLLLLGGGLMLMGQRAGRGQRVEAVPFSGRQALGAGKG
ncbi:MAG: MFS transporter [Pseudomonas sp.]|nr:MFS transporter [Pseudomonas sp.]